MTCVAVSGFAASAEQHVLNIGDSNINSSFLHYTRRSDVVSSMKRMHHEGVQGSNITLKDDGRLETFEAV